MLAITPLPSGLSTENTIIIRGEQNSTISTLQPKVLCHTAAVTLPAEHHVPEIHPADAHAVSPHSPGPRDLQALPSRELCLANDQELTHGRTEKLEIARTDPPDHQPPQVGRRQGLEELLPEGHHGVWCRTEEAAQGDVEPLKLSKHGK